MLFDPTPKSRRSDLFDRERELEELLKSIERNPLTVVSGIRRIGKTSLLLVAFGEVPGVLVDLRSVGRSKASLYRRIASGLEHFAGRHGDLWKKLSKQLERVTGVRISGSSVSMSWRGSGIDLADLLEKLAECGVAIAFDEVQQIRGPLGRELAEVLAYAYDHLELRIVLAGSEVGFLYDFIGREDPKAPLYGRYFREIKLERFDDETSREFLVRGFAEAGVEAPTDLIDLAVEKLDGIVGWLVAFGRMCLEKGFERRIVEDVLGSVSKLALSEFGSFVERHKPADRRILTAARAIAEGKSTWSEIKEYLEAKEGGELPDTTVARVLRALVKSSYVEKVVDGRNVRYRIADPVLEFALQRGIDTKNSIFSF